MDQDETGQPWRRGKPPQPERETYQEVIEEEMAAWREMGGLLRAGETEAALQLYEESRLRMELRREQARSGNFTELTVEGIRQLLKGRVRFGIGYELKRAE